MDKKTAVVTGGNKGIGLEICRQLAKNGFHVILTARDQVKGMQAGDLLKKEGLDVRVHPLDVSVPSSIDSFLEFMSKEYPSGLDVLVNNAGVFLDKESTGTALVLKTSVDLAEKTFQTNVYGPLRLTQAMAPFLIKKKGRVINMSSGMGQLSEMEGGYPAYRLSKTALNALTRMFSFELKRSGVSVNSVCPGWVKTDMGGPGATRTVEQGADTVTWLAAEAGQDLTGGFYRDRKPIEW